jgi:hypothetical protein
MTHQFKLLPLLALALLWPAPSVALDEHQKLEVRQLVKEGGAFFDKRNFAASRDKFTAALQLAKVPTVALLAGRAHEQLGELVKAAQLYLAASLMQPSELWAKKQTQEQARADARSALDALMPRIQSVRVQIKGTKPGNVKVVIDDVTVEPDALPFEQPLEPGDHVIVARQDEITVSESVRLQAHAVQNVVLDFLQAKAPVTVGPPEREQQTTPAREQVLASPISPEPQATPSALPSALRSTPPKSKNETHSYATWSCFAVGAAGLTLGATAGIIMWTKRSDLRDKGCSSGGECPRDGAVDQGAIDSHNKWRTISEVGYVFAGIGAVAGVALWLAQPKGETAPHVSVLVAPNGVGLDGAF